MDQVLDAPTRDLRARYADGSVAATVRFTSPADHTGHPAVSVPVGTGGPSGVQLIAPHYGERDLLSLAAALETLGN